MDKFYFGAHINVYDKLVDAAKEVHEAGGNLVQIFITIPGQNESTKELDDLKNFVELNKMKIVVHSAYIHNLAQNWDTYSWWIKNLELEIKYAHYVGAIGVVIHFGKKLDLTTEEAYNNMFSSLVYIHNKTKKYENVKLILETSTGQGTEICYKMEDLSYFYKKFSKYKEFKDRIKICIDTCHIFAAGYNLKTKNDVKFYLESFEELIGLRHVYLIHLNDSKGDLGCQKDRHAKIGKGKIGFLGLKEFFDYFKKLNIPIVLETPNEGYKEEIDNLLNY